MVIYESCHVYCDRQKTLKSITYPERFFSLFNWSTLKINWLWHYQKIRYSFCGTKEKMLLTHLIWNQINPVNAISIPSTTFYAHQESKVYRLILVFFSPHYWQGTLYCHILFLCPFQSHLQICHSTHTFLYSWFLLIGNLTY